MKSAVVLRRASLLSIAAVSFLVGTAGCGGEEAAPVFVPEVRVVSVVQKDVPISREWVGQTLGADDIEIRARVAGWLEGTHFVEGTEVKKGALLYSIDTSELEAGVAEAKGRLAEAQTMLVRAEADVDRYGPLAEAGAVSQRDLEIATAEYGARQGEVEAAEASLRLAEIDFSYATIRAPISGLIGLSEARVGDFVGRPPNPVILNTISRVDSVRVRFGITEQEYLEIYRTILERRADATAGPDDRPQKRQLELILADGSLYDHAGMVSFAQRQIDATTGTLQLEGTFPNPDRLLRPGQFARVRTVIEERKGALVIPARAMTELQGQYLVYAVGDDNVVKMRRVEIGPQAGGMIVIEAGLTTGEKVVVEGLQRIRPEMTVSPTEIPADSAFSEGGI